MPIWKDYHISFMLRTNFARGSVSVEGHGTIAIRGVSGRPRDHTGIPRFARVHGLHGKMATHGFGNRLAILAVLDALPCDILNLRTPGLVSVHFRRLRKGRRGHDEPVLEPDLNRSLSHVDVGGNAFPDHGCWRGIFVELDLECHQLILCGPLSLGILLLLCQGALAGRTTRAVEVGQSRDRRSGSARGSIEVWRVEQGRLMGFTDGFHVVGRR